MNKKLLWLIALLLIMPVSAEIFTQNQQADVKIFCLTNTTFCASTVSCNTTIFSSNQTLLANNAQMTNQNSFFNYTLKATETSTIGEYSVLAYCTDSATSTNANTYFKFDITSDGRPTPPALVILLFLVAFMILLGAMFWTVINVFEKAATLDISLIDLAYCFMAFSVVFMINRFNAAYFGDAIINQLSLIFISTGIFLQVIVPALLFYFSFMKHKFEERLRDDWGDGKHG